MSSSHLAHLPLASYMSYINNDGLLLTSRWLDDGRLSQDGPFCAPELFFKVGVASHQPDHFRPTLVLSWTRDRSLPPP